MNKLAMKSSELASILKEKVDLLNPAQLEQLNSLADLFLTTAPGEAEWEQLTPESLADFEKSLAQIKELHLSGHADVQARMRAKHVRDA